MDLGFRVQRTGIRSRAERERARERERESGRDRAIDRESPGGQREVLIDNSLVLTKFFITLVWWTVLAPWELEFPFFR